MSSPAITAADEAADLRRDLEIAARNGTAERFGAKVSIDVLGIFVLRKLDEVSRRHTEFDWMACNFRTFEDMGIPRPIVRGILQELRNRGFVAFERGLWDEDGQPAGSGYRILDKGREVLEAWPARGWLDG